MPPPNDEPAPLVTGSFDFDDTHCYTDPDKMLERLTAPALTHIDAQHSDHATFDHYDWAQVADQLDACGLEDDADRIRQRLHRTDCCDCTQFAFDDFTGWANEVLTGLACLNRCFAVYPHDHGQGPQPALIEYGSLTYAALRELGPNEYDRVTFEFDQRTGSGHVTFNHYGNTTLRVVAVTGEDRVDLLRAWAIAAGGHSEHHPATEVAELSAGDVAIHAASHATWMVAEEADADDPDADDTLVEDLTFDDATAHLTPLLALPEDDKPLAAALMRTHANPYTVADVMRLLDLVATPAPI